MTSVDAGKCLWGAQGGSSDWLYMPADVQDEEQLRSILPPTPTSCKVRCASHPEIEMLYFSFLPKPQTETP